jgi:uncharacterized glyoxalase superfamily protein PhnB
MPEKVTPIPEGFHTITPHLTVRDATKAIEFYKSAFGAEALGVVPGPGGKVMHALLKIGDSMLMLVDEFPEWHCLSPLALGGTGVTLHIYIEDVDAAFARAVSAGANATMPVMDAFWGDRYGQVTDPFGHKWSLATRKQILTPDEVAKAQEEAFAKMPKSA